VILLDTHVLIWMSSEPKRLSKRAREAIREARDRSGREKSGREDSGIAVAAITLWELAWLANSGRLRVAGSVESYVRETVSRVIVKPITAEIAALAVQMPADFPKDPADRMIVATAAVEGLTLVTADERIQQAKRVSTIW
jgi:PIN domain nuclease of toxin-antitoxin system